jgi:hypothetical protein
MEYVCKASRYRYDINNMEDLSKTDKSQQQEVVLKLLLLMVFSMDGL